MPIGDIYRMVRKVEFNGQAHYNVLHFLQTEEVAEPEEVTLAEHWDATTGSGLDPTSWAEARLMGLQKGYTTLTKVGMEVQRISPTEGDAVLTPFFSSSYSPTDDGVPTFSQVKVSILTALNNRSGRGGFYIGAIADNATTGNVVTTTYANDMAEFLTALLQSFSPGHADYSGFTLGVWSRLLQEFNPVEVLSASTTMGTMRSRRAGRGI